MFERTTEAMSYDFTFDKKTAVLMAIGCLAIGILLFLAGFIVGIDRTSGQAEAAAKQPSAQSGPQTKTPAQETEQPPPALQKPSPEQRKQASSPASAPAEGSQTSATQGKTELPPGAGGDSNAKAAEAKEQSGFSLQMGAFQTEENAVKLRDNLKSKGYPVFLFRVLDADGHLWHTVRMGHYPDMKKASQSAATFTSKEQISPWVRPSNAF
jgi:cell division septation protein DedD